MAGQQQLRARARRIFAGDLVQDLGGVAIDLGLRESGRRRRATIWRRMEFPAAR
jgi:hypothetical protein